MKRAWCAWTLGFAATVAVLLFSAQFMPALLAVAIALAAGVVLTGPPAVWVVREDRKRHPQHHGG